MALFKFEFVFATIMCIQKHVVMRLDREISSAIFFFFCGLTVCVAWPLVWLDRLVMGWPFTKKLLSPVVFSENGQATTRRLNWFLQPLWTFERTCSYGLALKYPGLFFIVVWPCVWFECLVVTWRFTEKKYCAGGIQYFSSSCQINKLTRKISYSNKVLRTFRHGTLNNHVPGITFFEFSLHALSIKSYHNWYWLRL